MSIASSLRAICQLVLAACCLAWLPARSAAQGDLRVIAVAPVSEPARRTVENFAREGLAQLAPSFPGTPSRPITMFVHESAETLPDAVRAAIHPGTAGVALLRRDEIHILLEESRRVPPNDLRTVVLHELVHTLLDQYAGRASLWVSRWFHEGLAQELSGGAYIGMSEDDLILTVIGDRLLRFSDLEQDFPHERSELRRAYAQSFSFVGFLRREFGLETLIEAARHSTADQGYQRGLYDLTRTPLFDVEDEWRNYLRSGSGAGLRFLLDNCFSYLMIGAFVLLALAGMRRWRRDALTREKLEREEQLERAAELEHQQQLPHEVPPQPPRLNDP